MKLLKHILIIVALLLAGLPCTHAHTHDEQVAAAESILASSPCCDCHSGAEAPCQENLEVPQLPVQASVVALLPASCFEWFVVNEIRPALRPLPPTLSGILASLQTVQLQI